PCARRHLAPRFSPYAAFLSPVLQGRSVTRRRPDADRPRILEKSIGALRFRARAARLARGVGRRWGCEPRAATRNRAAGRPTGTAPVVLRPRAGEAARPPRPLWTALPSPSRP